MNEQIINSSFRDAWKELSVQERTILLREHKESMKWRSETPTPMNREVGINLVFAACEAAGKKRRANGNHSSTK